MSRAYYGHRVSLTSTRLQMLFPLPGTFILSFDPRSSIPAFPSSSFRSQQRGRFPGEPPISAPRPALASHRTRRSPCTTLFRARCYRPTLGLGHHLPSMARASYFRLPACIPVSQLPLHFLCRTGTQATPGSPLTPEGRVVSTAGASYDAGPQMRAPLWQGLGSGGGLRRQPSDPFPLSTVLAQPLEMDTDTRHRHSSPVSPAVPSCGSRAASHLFLLGVGVGDQSFWKPSQVQLS